MILSRILADLSPAEMERLRTKAAEGQMALELDQLEKVHQFQASTSDIQQFIEQVKQFEFTHRHRFSTYKASGEFQTATGRTTFESQKKCFVATAVFGDAEHPDVAFLRRLRDTRLQHFAIGRRFVAVYESIGPKMLAYRSDIHDFDTSSGFS
jgi:hypothetical protein